MPDDVFTVHGVTEALSELLSEAVPPLWVEGEVSNFSQSQAGHWYFTLRDAKAQLPCVMWKSVAWRFRDMMPETGALVRVYGSLSIYAQGGVYQIQATRLLPVGQGALRIAFERLRDRLRLEGLFDERRKKPIPRFPAEIGVVTSPRGAAVRDIVKVIGGRYPCARVTIYPVVVQGDQAAGEIASAIDLMNLVGEADVLIVGRGGGSMEDLWAFNEEIVARAIAASVIPVVSAVGHEIDFTLADFAADVRAATPSAAAEQVVPDRDALVGEMRGYEARMRESVTSRLRFARQELARLSEALAPRRQLDRVRQRAQRVDDLAGRLEAATRRRAADTRTRLESLAASLNALSPLATLGRGYSICRHADGRIVRDVQHVASGEAIRVRLARGSLGALVTDRTEGDGRGEI
ncbi:exodeoxyribonuclease VII large subunit [Candidatus Poribacteria bacterium]|nr:exodeoxyribonuclease VII large subunit [Candidatus Poribacteria bacterium]